jgi:hypothetical protein
MFARATAGSSDFSGYICFTMRRLLRESPKLVSACALTLFWACGGGSSGGGNQAASDGGADPDGGGGAGGVSIDTSAVSVLQHHGNLARSGAYVDALVTKSAAAKVHLDTTFTGVIDGVVYAQSLFVKNGPGGKPAVIAVTEKNNVYALDAQSGAELFHVQVATPVAEAVLKKHEPNNSSSNPLGITSTPVIDETGRRIYLDAMTTPDPTGIVMAHQVFALSLDDGTPVPGWPLDVTSAVSGFDSSIQNQRGALALVNGILYVPFGGFNGDGGPYRGRLLGVSVATAKLAGSYVTPALLGGSWGPSGVASDGTNVFIATGNTSGATMWGGGEAILRFQSGPVFSGATTDYFAPSNWQALDSADLDLGGSGAVLVDLPGATPSKLVVALGKNGVAYLVDRENLGGVSKGNGTTGEGAFSFSVDDSAIRTAPATYKTAMGTYVVFNSSGNGVGCPAGQSGSLVAFSLVPGPPLSAHVAWCADTAGEGAPIATTTDGTAEPVVWVMGAQASNLLYAFDGDTGALIAKTPPVGNVNRWIAPIDVEGRIFVAGDNAVYAFSMQ